MKIILTSDVELWSWNRDFKQDVEAGVLRIMKLCEEEKIPITLFVSLSDKGYAQKDYLPKIKNLLDKLKSKYVHFGVHTHCKNLPIDYSNISDDLNQYSEAETVKILKWYKQELESATHTKIFVHRAGGYNIPNLMLLERCFKNVGLKIDSSLLKRAYSEPLKIGKLKEISPATNFRYVNKKIVWSPEQMTLKEMAKFYNEAKTKTGILVINFHSFSVYGDLGWKKKMWYKIPFWARFLFKPIIEMLKYLGNSNKKKSNNPKISESFINLYKTIKFLKADGCVFTSFENTKK
jgi:hypothetical protein